MTLEPAITPGKRDSLVRSLLSWFSRNARDLPWRRTLDPYAIWVSEIMLQQTQVKTVVPYWQRWMRALPAIEDLARADSSRLHKLWEGLGYYARVRNMRLAAQRIVQSHGGKFPEKIEDVLALPGIGRYTAGAVCSIAFNQPQAILDGNIIRVLTRLFGIAGDPRGKRANARLWRIAQELVARAAELQPAKTRAKPPNRRLWNTAEFPACSFLNQSLMELGALVCTPRRPNCALCPVRRHCVARRQNRTGQLPSPGRRVAPTRRRFAAFILKHRGRLLVRQRPPGIINAALWEFPNAELRDTRAGLPEAAREALGFIPRSLLPFCEIRHSITRFRILLQVFVAGGAARGLEPEAAGKWCAPAELAGLAFPSAHRRILAQLRNSDRTRSRVGH